MKIKIVFILVPVILLVSCDYSTEPFKEGKRIYNVQCAACHGYDGEGLGTLYPDLFNEEFIKANRGSISCWIYKGIGPDSTNAKQTRFSDQTMPAITVLTEIDICNVLNYLNARFWNMEPYVLQEIKTNMEACKNSKNEMKQPLMVK